jgi:SPP1 family predicted phage head-tail adaptor
MIGQMRDRVTIKLEQKSDNGRGGWLIQEVDMGTYWAKIEDLREANIIQYRQADKQTNTRITMRANDVINNNCVIYARGNYYRIEEIIEKDGFITLLTVGEKIAQLP